MERTHSAITWHTEVIPAATLRALDFFSNEVWIADSSWYLAGGTALALQVGHRSSEDLDFFTTEKNFATNDVLQHLPAQDWQSQIVRDGTIWGEYKEAKVSFISYPFYVPIALKLKYGNISVLDARDIAVMKIVAMSQRGRKRDFLDLYWYAKHAEPLIDVIRRLPEQYPGVAHDYHHILKSLLYFDDAENDPMPSLYFKTDWNEIKRYFKAEVPGVAKELLGVGDEEQSS